MADNVMINYRIEGQFSNIRAHSHQEFEIFLFHKGVCRYLIHNQIYDLQPGDILLMDGLALHKPNIPDNSEYIRSHIHFSPEFIEPLLESMNASSLLNVFRSIHHCLIRPRNQQLGHEIEALFKSMRAIYVDQQLPPEEKIWEIKAMLAHLLIFINRLGKVSSHKQVNHKHDKAYHAETIASYIQTHFHKKLTIQKIADELSLSKSYVSHVFKEMTGYTVMEYVMATRLQQVKFLLEVEVDKTLEQVANECGFESVSHFSRFFKNHVGMTARSYRQKRLEIYKRSDE
ncbi:AraC family transcriptional regulator [Gracilibacillus caseinilyticus]|uniref:AraC family transcriptional regulator n=1 Tax=Gracilibacillus caseinilyticus TaxID=2932256 RepID=A0ABY4EVT9_9BACI|nr:helix-turn-helix domain-containing protein [Gracilibacillus caseinilyticus]UOQ48504.1 AraC family transcriptional regulator [Gracilibacillus caseinilyticus]